MVYAKTNLTDFHTCSILQINCSNTHSVNFPYDFAAIECQNEIINVQICKNAFSAKAEIRSYLKRSPLFDGFVLKFKFQKSDKIILAKEDNKNKILGE